MGFRDLLGKELLFFDGATGTMLQALGLQPGELPELWNFTHAAEVQSVHEAYLNNGSNIIKSNTYKSVCGTESRPYRKITGALW